MVHDQSECIVHLLSAAAMTISYLQDPTDFNGVSHVVAIRVCIHAPIIGRCDIIL